MKRTNIYKPGICSIVFLALLTGTLFTSCLKDKGPVQDYSQSPALVSFQYTGNTAQPFNEALLPNPSDTINIEVTLSVASLTLSKPVTVTLTPDATALASYNAANGTSYTMLPTSEYTLANNGQVTISPGQQIVTVPLIVKGDQVDFTQNNALSFTLSNAQGAVIATNLNNLILLFSLKNIYDGVYSVTGTLTDAFNPGITGDYPLTVDLITDGKSGVDYSDAANGLEHLIKSGTSTSFYGNFAPVFNFDANGNVISVVNNPAYGQGTNSQARSAALDPTGINKFDFNTRTLQVSYYLVQGGAQRTHFVETYTYLGPR